MVIEKEIYTNILKLFTLNKKRIVITSMKGRIPNIRMTDQKLCCP